MNYDKLKAVANLESDIGEVIDGLTELAERFPEDFTSLMDTFHEPHQPRLNHLQQLQSADTRSISPMDILNLANMITQVIGGSLITFRMRRFVARFLVHIYYL